MSSDEMSIDDAENILTEAIAEAYPYWSSSSYLESYQKASDAIDLLAKLARSNITDVPEKVTDKELDYIKEITKVPKCYIEKIPYCDVCNVELEQTGFNLLSNPPKVGYKCNKCGKEFYIDERKIGGHWEWKT